MNQESAIDCLVVGAGPAGLTAAMYLRRFHRRVHVVDEGESRARYIPRSHNYPGFPEGVGGSDILERLRAQLRDVGGRIVGGTVSALARGDQGFVAEIAGQRVRAPMLLLATGVCDNEPRLPGVDEIRDAGLLRQCPICDGYEHSGRRIAIIGCGEHGVREALFIRDFSDDVSYIPLEASDPACREGAQQLALNGITVIAARPREVSCTPGGGIAMAMHDGSTLHFDVLYAALGTKPRSSLALSLGAKADALGNVVVDRHCETSVRGLFAAGDVVSALDQLVVATAHGAIAATAIHNRLREETRGL